jgi:hypothetical protein
MNLCLAGLQAEAVQVVRQVEVRPRVREVLLPQLLMGLTVVPTLHQQAACLIRMSYFLLFRMNNAQI